MIQIPLEPLPSRQDRHDDPAWLRLGFRPFYLLSAVFATAAIPLWLAQRAGMLFHGYLSGAYWHQHEMIFGFATAVIIGFLFTAGKVWTGLQTPEGPSLLGFALLWLAARLALPLTPAWLAVPVDLALLPTAAWVMVRLVWRSQTYRHLPIVGVLIGLAICNLLFHLSLLQALSINPMTPLHAALAFIVMLVATMAGRVIPGFTANALPEAKIRRYPWLNKLSHLMMGLAMISVVVEINPKLTIITTCIAAFLHLALLWCWDSFSTRRKPILAILHLSYAWIPVGLLMFSAAELGWVPVSLAWHALAVGAMSGMIAGMITRTALGHTGRALIAGKVEMAFYLMVQLAALTRVIPGIFWPQYYNAMLGISATLWSSAFLIYSVGYFPILTQPRIDGRPG